jgi:hypothetical protein
MIVSRVESTSGKDRRDRGENVRGMRTPERRQFLSGLVASAVWPTVAQVQPSPEDSRREPTALLATLAAVADTIVPRDRDPGATDAGVPDRIVESFREDADRRALYRDGLALVESLAQKGGAASFAALDAGARERLLSSLAGRAGERTALGPSFYRQVRADVLRYYWASEAGQRAVRYDPPAAGYPPPSQR